jgi:hypothetical protein
MYIEKLPKTPEASSFVLELEQLRFALGAVKHRLANPILRNSLRKQTYAPVWRLLSELARLMNTIDSMTSALPGTSSSDTTNT